MVQKEAAQRVLAGPSTSEYGPLALRAQYYARPRLARIVEAACFTPPPKVDSAFLCMPFREEPPVSVPDDYAVHSVSYLIKGLCKDCRYRQSGAIKS